MGILLALEYPTAMSCRLQIPARREAGFTIVELVTAMVVLGLIIATAIPRLQMVIEQARVARAIGDIRAIQADIQAYEAGSGALPLTLADIQRDQVRDPWGRLYVYLNFSLTPGPVPPGARRDRFLVPINSSFDLFSVGKDGSSAPPLNAAHSSDDVVRGNDGGFIGLGRKF